jgi:hypothetical protein
MSNLVEPIGKIDRNSFLIPRKGSNGFQYELDEKYTNEEEEGDQYYLGPQELLSLTLITLLGPLWTVASVQLIEEDGDTDFENIVITSSPNGNLAITCEGLMRFEDLKQKYRNKYGYDKTANIVISPYDSELVLQRLQEEEDELDNYFDDAVGILGFLKDNCLLVKQFKGIDSSEHLEMYDTVHEEIAERWGDKQYLDALKFTYSSIGDLLPNHATLNTKDNFTIAMEYKPFFLNKDYVNKDNKGLGDFLKKARETGTIVLPDFYTLATEDEGYEDFYLVNPDLTVKSQLSTITLHNSISRYASRNNIPSKKIKTSRGKRISPTTKDTFSSLEPGDTWKCDDKICLFTGPPAY